MDKFTEEQLRTGKALSAYLALMRWFDTAVGVQITGEDSVKNMIWLDQILKLIEKSPEHQFVSDHAEEIWPIALKAAKKKLEEVKKGTKK